MTVLFDDNLEVINRRWPLLSQVLNTASVSDLNAHLVQGREQTISVNGIQLSSRHNRIAEAQLLIGQLPRNCSRATVYGVGMGDVPTILVQNSTIKRINICLLNVNLFSLLLTYTDQREWLSDQRLELEYQPQQNRLPQHYIAITPELLLSSDENARLRDLLAFNNNITYANKKHNNVDAKLKQRMIENLATIKKDSDAADLSSYYQPNKTLVIATGPTLEQHYTYLRVQRALPESTRPLMISVDTALKALLNENIIPDIVVSLDQHMSRQLLPDNIPASVKLVYFPKSRQDVLQWWPGQRFAAYSLSQVYDELYQLAPKLRLFTNGSVIHPAIDLAVHLKSQTIILFGCDFSYPHNKTHAFWQDGELGISIAHTKKHWVMNGYGEKVATDLSFRGYLLALENYIYSKPHVTFYNASLDGATINGVPYQECKS
ncbi:motility associated factor glycosyltransferase family protein [Shewanella sp. S23-S33]|uniref:motility associated factor glycosyltransferase family protein n=1 Tax=Shewanella sp. S23-S33 TaxID=3342769 RepID=UPI00372D45CE